MIGTLVVPLNSQGILDYDNDGITNIEEVELGLSTYTNDTDDDGLEDNVEILMGLNPLIEDPEEEREYTVKITNNNESEVALATIEEEPTEETTAEEVTREESTTQEPTTERPTQPPVQQLPPKAGDATPISWLATLMLLAAAGLLLMRRKAAR